MSNIDIGITCYAYIVISLLLASCLIQWANFNKWVYAPKEWQARLERGVVIGLISLLWAPICASYAVFIIVKGFYGYFSWRIGRIMIWFSRESPIPRAKIQNKV